MSIEVSAKDTVTDRKHFSFSLETQLVNGENNSGLVKTTLDQEYSYAEYKYMNLPIKYSAADLELIQEELGITV